MKKLLIIVGLVLATGVINLNAQSTNQTPNQTFYSTAIGWATSVDTNKNWLGKVDIWTAAGYQNNLNFADYLGGDVQVWSPSTNSVLSAEGSMGNAGVVGTIVSGQGGLLYQYRKYDFALGGFIDGGYRPTDGRGFVEFGGDARKLMTRTSFALIRLGIQPQVSQYPMLYVGLGGTF